MARALSDDLRVRVVRAPAAGLSARRAATRFGVGIATAIRWIARARTVELTARPQGWRRGSRLDAREAFIVGLAEHYAAGDDDPAPCRTRGLDPPQRAERLAPGAGLDVQKSPPMYWSRSVPTS